MFKEDLHYLRECFRNRTGKEDVSMTLLVLTYQFAGPKYANSVSACFQFKKSLYVIDFCCNLPINSKQKQVKATEVYLLWVFCEKTLSNY